MTDWYKMNPVDWNDGTDELSLEQEAAYLRICHAIYITERPVSLNWFVIAGLLRCNDRKAKRLVSELVEIGKLVIEDGHISNRRTIEEVSTRRRVSADRASAGSRGGIESGKARAKRLETLETGEAIATKQNEPEEKRLEESREPPNPLERKRHANPIVILQSEVDPMTAQKWVSHCEEKGKRPSSHQAEAMCGVLREIRAAGGNPTEAVQLAIRKGWVSLELEYLTNSGFKMAKAPVAQQEDWAGRLEVWRQGTWAPAWGPKPGERNCRVPPELLHDAAA